MQSTILKTFDKATGKTKPSWEKLMELFRAVNADDMLTVQKFVDRYGIAQTTDSTDQRTALMAAAGAGKADIVRYLLAAGSPVDARAEDGDTAFCRAIGNNHVECAKILLEAGAQVDPHGLTCNWHLLHSTVGFDHYDSFLFLIEQDVALDSKNDSGTTPLMHAVRTYSGNKHHTENSDRYIEKLLAAGADMSCRDNEGRSALDDARDYGLTNIVNLMQKQHKENMQVNTKKPVIILKPLRFKQRALS